jgi:8-oxo-dGTP diphosphatase
MKNINKRFDMHKAAGIVIVDRKLLVTREVGKEIFISPGGTVEPGESPVDTVIRELHEEVNINTSKEDLEEFGVFYAEAADHPGKWLRMDTYLVKSWEGEIAPNNDDGQNSDDQIEEIKWLTSEIPKGIKVGSIFEHEVIPRLVKTLLID